MHKLSSNAASISQSSLHSNYKKTILPNGLRVVTEEIPYVRSISIGVWINVGSRDETETTNGISHFLEHMVFKGTKRYSAQQIARSLERVGGYLNAFTTKEHTCYFARILDENLTEAVDVISDMVQRPVFVVKEMEKEKGVILEELKNIEDDPDDLIHDYFDGNVFSKHPLGFPIIGRAQNIKSFSKNDLTDYVVSHYIPSRMVVSAAGNLKHEKLVDLVEKFFNGKSSSNGSSVRPSGPKRMQPKKEVYEKPIMQAHICLGTLGYGVKSRQRYPLLVLNTLLGEGMSSRLFQNIREKYGFAYTVYSFANLMSDTGSFGVYVGTAQNKIDRSIELIYRELEKAKTKPIMATELKRTKAQIKGSMMLSLESMSNRMMRLGSGEFFFGQYIPLDEILRSIDAVKAEDVQKIARKLFQFENFSAVIIKPKESNASPAQKIV
ncbi:MAG: insulinase family protein [Ignavibacteriae bacterium]|nr:insulinase family protein [Ignavibacteria bacterium]MBI3365443.1 insulinase family protein [Ignavibacteriota bacterium]